MTKEVPALPGRSRIFLVTFVLLFSGSTLVLGLCSLYFYGEWTQASSDREKFRQQAQYHHDNMVLAGGSLEAAFSAALHKFYRDDLPISYQEAFLLIELVKHYQQFVVQNAGIIELRSARARGLHLLGIYHHHTNSLHLAEKKYREALAAYDEMLAEEPIPEEVLLAGETNNHLCHLLAETGRFADAEHVNAVALQHFTKLLDETPEWKRVRLEYAIACNNAGILALASGRDDKAVPHIQRSLALLQGLSREEPKNVHMLKRLIDAHQLLAGVRRRGDRHAEAKQLWSRALDLLTELNEHRNSSAVQPLTYSSARRMAARQRDAETTTRGLSPWSWTPLSPRNGKTLRPDVFLQGKLRADFETQQGLLLTFRWQDAYWYQAALLKIVNAVASRLPVTILVPDDAARQVLVEELSASKVNLAKIRFLEVDTDSIWARDYGPLAITTKNNSSRWVDTLYAPDRIHDDRVPAKLGQLLDAPPIRASLLLPGGNLLTNGQGVCLTSTRTVSINEALGYSKQQVTAQIKRLFGAAEVVYLESLIEEKTGDVDWFAAFTAPDTVVVGDYKGIDPVNAALLDRNAERLRQVMTPSGPLRVVRIPMPPRGEDFFGGTYTNVLFANGVLLVPTWANADPKIEKQVLDTYRRLLPGWEIVGIPSREMGVRGGALRCASMPVFR